MSAPDSRRPPRSGSDVDRGQIVLVAAAVVAVALLSMTLAYAQLGYDADRTGAGTVEVASVAEIDRSLTGSLRATARAVRRGDDHAWRDRRAVAERVVGSLDTDADRLERAHAEESRSLTVELDDAAATQWARDRCPGGDGREFGPCRVIDGVVVQERADETAVVAAAFRIRILSPDESTTAFVVPQVVQAPPRSETTTDPQPG
ncbi:hypothetical protein GCM10008995_22170 [Halobellus salinus]|uniref:Uncharacterized protein n=1 Tax=Halobellus salinus TaxID=931585 RepID=A0A830EC84_9EURY|nr:hypothetical protein [Halobellus salinus]GGJ11831.1 hypothetical protein GCM10008995_22170 [Halobellus salinus]